MSIDPREIHDRAGLVAFLDGRTDAEIEEATMAVGADEILGKVFAAMETDYDAASGPKEPVVVQWNVRAPDGALLSWQVSACAEVCRIDPGSRTKPDLTLTLGMASFLKLVVGQLSGIKALTTGKLKLKGNRILAMSIERWFIRR